MGTYSDLSLLERTHMYIPLIEKKNEKRKYSLFNCRFHKIFSLVPKVEKKADKKHRYDTDLLQF